MALKQQTEKLVPNLSEKFGKLPKSFPWQRVDVINIIEYETNK